MIQCILYAFSKSHMISRNQICCGDHESDSSRKMLILLLAESDFGKPKQILCTLCKFFMLQGNFSCRGIVLEVSADFTINIGIRRYNFN